MVFTHSFVFFLKYKTASFNCCYTRSAFFMLSFLIHDIKNRLRVCQSNRDQTPSKTMKKRICENQCQTFNFLFLPKKFKSVVLCRFIMANLRTGSKRMD